MAVATERGRRQVSIARNLATIIDFASRTQARAVSVLALVVLLSILPGFFSIPPTDRDEARFAQATKQMIESGDYIDIRFQNEVRYKKPVGIYWLQAGVVTAASALGVERALTSIWLYRIPSLVGAIGAVMLTYWAALAFVSRQAAVTAGLMVASCVLLGIEGRLAKTDAVLLVTAVAAMGALARVYLRDQPGNRDAVRAWTVPFIFWTALAASILVKGPLVPMIVVLAVATLAVIDRSAGWVMALRPMLGIIWLAVLVLPWFVAIVLRAGDSFFVESVGQDLLAKVARGQETHGAPPGYYFLLFWLTFWPGALLAGLAVPAIWTARREPGVKFLLAWVVPSWILFELVPTKLPHYVLPLYPAIAILIAGVVHARMLSRRPWLERSTIWWFLIPVLAGIVAIVALFVTGRQTGFLIWPAIGMAAIMGLLAWKLYDPARAEHGLLCAVAASILAVIGVFGLAIPSFSQLFPSASLATALGESGCAEPLAAAAGYHEPSLVFLAGTTIRLTDGPGAADFLHAGGCRFAFIEASQEHGFAERAAAIGLRYSAGPHIDAINVGSGRAIAVAIYRSEAQL